MFNTWFTFLGIGLGKRLAFSAKDDTFPLIEEYRCSSTITGLTLYWNAEEVIEFALSSLFSRKFNWADIIHLVSDTHFSTGFQISENTPSYNSYNLEVSESVTYSGKPLDPSQKNNLGWEPNPQLLISYFFKNTNYETTIINYGFKARAFCRIGNYVAICSCTRR